jgi:hypothetical protein
MAAGHIRRKTKHPLGVIRQRKVFGVDGNG